MTTTRSSDLPVFPASDRSVPQSAPELAASAADSVRLLNHATVIVDVTGGPETWPGYQTPADVADTIASLKRVVEMLPQVFAQAERWLTAALATGRVGDDRRTFLARTTANDPAMGVSNAVSDLHASTSVAELLAMNLGLAHAALSHLTYDLDDPDDLDDDLDAQEDDEDTHDSDSHNDNGDDSNGGL